MGSNPLNKQCKPIMKWAGGKSQLLAELLPRVPEKYGKYIEPFFGGGALFFALEPDNAIISDSNPELINMYSQVADNVEEIIDLLGQYENNESFYYDVRALDWTSLTPSEAAARTLYLNHTCFNGLYRVNRNGDFNTPFGRYKNPVLCDADGLRRASALLSRATILCGDYYDVLEKNACEGDFIFLDPPYVPVSGYSDFKRYTKEQFYDSDQKRLASLTSQLLEKGCSIVLTNSNHPLVTDLYGNYPMTVVQTKRNVSSKGTSRRGEDVIVDIGVARSSAPLSLQVKRYPATRYMGSKRKMLDSIWDVVAQFNPKTALDLFSGSGVVSYMMKAQGIQVFSNDYMSMSSVFAKALVENSTVRLGEDMARRLMLPNRRNDGFVASTFQGLYYSDSENNLIDDIRANIKELEGDYERQIAMMALIRACTKKRPRGIFTYTGHRYDDGRRDLAISFEEQFIKAVNDIDAAVFDNGKGNVAYNCNAMELEIDPPDLVYLDPPYYSKHSDNEYVRRYHFLEGLARDWEGVEIQQHTKTKKFKSYPTPFSSEQGTIDAFCQLFDRYASSIIVVSYSSNSLPERSTMVKLLSERKRHVDIVPIDYRYHFGNRAQVKNNRNVVKEYLFVGY